MKNTIMFKSVCCSALIHIIIILVLFLLTNIFGAGFSIAAPKNIEVTVKFQSSTPKIAKIAIPEKIPEKLIPTPLEKKKNSPIKPPPKVPDKNPNLKSKTVTQNTDTDKIETKGKTISANVSNGSFEVINLPGLSAREQLHITNQITACRQRAEKFTGNISKRTVKLVITIDPEGYFNINTLEILNNEQLLDEEGRIAIKNAKRTLVECNPLRNLPLDKYQLWRRMEIVLRVT